MSFAGLDRPAKCRPVGNTRGLCGSYPVGPQIPDPEATRQGLGRLSMTPSTTFPLYVAPIDGNRD